MKISKRLFWIIPIVIVFTPIIVNYILTREIVCYYDVAGCGVDWINFYGSFLGSALTAFIAYYVLVKTIQNENRENLIKRKRQEYDWLRNDLSERISQIEVTDVFRVFLYDGAFDIKQELDRLMSLLYDYKTKSNSSMLKYGLEKEDVKCKEFFEEYNEFLGDVCIAINNMMGILAKHMYRNDYEALNDDLSIMNGVMKELNKRPTYVFKRAEAYLISKKKELEKL